MIAQLERYHVPILKTNLEDLDVIHQGDEHDVVQQVEKRFAVFIFDQAAVLLEERREQETQILDEARVQRAVFRIKRVFKFGNRKV